MVACIKTTFNEDYNVYDFVSVESGIDIEESEIAFTTEIDECEFVDDARIVRRAIQIEFKLFWAVTAQVYIDFLQQIFSIVPNRGAPREVIIPKQANGYGYLFLHYLF